MPGHPRASAISLGDCAEQALRSLVLAGAARGAPPVPVTIGALPVARADPVLMRLAFADLIGHAIGCTRGAADGRVEVFATVVDGRRAVCVQDNGVGGVADAQAGGDGLALVRAIVERQGGEAWARAQPGRGARCYLALPGIARIAPESSAN